MLEFQFEREPRLRDKRKPVVTYCTAGARSVLAAERLEQMGWRDVVTLDARYEDWERGVIPRCAVVTKKRIWGDTATER
jgi:rhodanese-related sulfurtransferase